MRREKKRFVAQDGHGKRYTLVLFSEVGPGGKVRERIETETGKRVWRVEKGVYEMGYTAKKLHSTDPDAP
ncbi:MAG TPA: hypothetical protein VIL46_01300 [Gemmataceae bacterium]